MVLKQASRQVSPVDSPVVSDAEWREMARDCRERSREWTAEGRATYGVVSHWSAVPPVVSIALVAAIFVAIVFYCLEQFGPSSLQHFFK